MKEKNKVLGFSVSIIILLLGAGILSANDFEEFKYAIFSIVMAALYFIFHLVWHIQERLDKER